MSTPKVNFNYRHKTMRRLGRIIEKIYGRRCLSREAGCMTCTAWMAFDMMENLTDSSLLDEPTDQEAGDDG